jgi:beta-galactosidase
LHAPYEAPQENGNRADTRWLKLSDAAGLGIRASRVDESDMDNQGLFDFYAQHYAAADLSKARHPTELHKLDEVVLRRDAARSGLGTNSCGPGVLENIKFLAKR